MYVKLGVTSNKTVSVSVSTHAYNTKNNKNILQKISDLHIVWNKSRQQPYGISVKPSEVWNGHWCAKW